MKKWTALTLFVACDLCRCQMCSRNFPKDVRSYSYTEQLSGTLFQKTKARVTYKIGLCVITFLDFVFSFLCIYRTTCSLHIHLQGQTDPYRESYMSDLGPARSIYM